ncbi:dTDP-4-dehydrorhamnose 3,5-epimerase [candidate division WOR-1 bacterium RIFCSPHIGHO2_01_FULL_53_15]|uniref:dTDP-4-dehydrorhamnose 3,5-epimerase n=1 Tax=candidate division WOR-1 bacterium RIFCSPHIGHO2_01_FULL_53_15 TaxID=1802564 RepID=A0A1F4Q4L6_UNCSA|nr:MAG: dTDP-4-dehydrorhamnose 3,5-epimerase [candidate division WOR-1 bacterium RIFCSPHIGHO2_01_FULL_53_15]OGC13250.1 MAG: dTDP-4-dehydrorhamnose 3,5-epimerase [candidate division WOR-1 bacterium RIFCSPHIGHO2_02_FULL_53_26]
MGNFKAIPSPIPEILIIEPKVFGDDRGFFMEFYNKNGFAEIGLTDAFVQDNHSRSKKGVVRGLHYQTNPAPMGKLVKCARGRIFDAGVDVRRGSPTFGQWYGEVLTGENHKMLYFPPGFAHGFLCLEDDTDVIYACTGAYSPADERALLWNDPALGIKWPLEEVKKAIVSEKDAQNPKFKDAETNFIYVR